MRLLALLGVVGLGVVCCAAARADDEFPYKAYVTAADVYVRSGPGRNYYPTLKMQKGDTVEVWRHDPGGWCAIRPPQGSFSWVSARHVDRDPDGLGVVILDQATARVGSAFSSVRDVVQVRLDKSELVEILDEHNAGGQTWYTVAPPSGEFRWISSKYLDTRPPIEGLSRPRRISALDDDRVDEYAHDDDAPLDVRREVELAAYDDVEYDAGDDLEYLESDASEIELVDHTQPATGGRRTVPLRQSESRRAAAGSLAAELEAIEHDLSAMVAEEPTVWALNDLRIRADALIEEAVTAVERGRVRQLRYKIARFEDIQKRYQQMNHVLDETDRRNDQLNFSGLGRGRFSSSGAREAVGRPVIAERELSFDGKGVLRPVVSKRADAPPYALVDELGSVLSFVTPTPGLNLQPYIGQYIGMTGSRGFMPELGKAHLTVQRVTPLGEIELVDRPGLRR